MSSVHTDVCSECQRLRDALRGVIMAWDQLYSQGSFTQFPFAEDLEFGPVSRARIAYDSDWYQNNAFGNRTDETKVQP